VPEDEAPAPSCDDTKMRTSGMAESFAQGARCDFLYLCTALADREPFESLVLEHFPEAECAEGRDCLEHMGAEICACDEGATGHCKLWIEEIDAEEAAAGCTLSRNRQVNHLTCAGDL
jgi:hypothetical protein